MTGTPDWGKYRAQDRPWSSQKRLDLLSRHKVRVLDSRYLQVLTSRPPPDTTTGRGPGRPSRRPPLTGTFQGVTPDPGLPRPGKKSRPATTKSLYGPQSRCRTLTDTPTGKGSLRLAYTCRGTSARGRTVVDSENQTKTRGGEGTPRTSLLGLCRNRGSVVLRKGPRTSLETEGSLSRTETYGFSDSRLSCGLHHTSHR